MWPYWQAISNTLQRKVTSLIRIRRDRLPGLLSALIRTVCTLHAGSRIRFLVQISLQANLENRVSDTLGATQVNRKSSESVFNLPQTSEPRFFKCEANHQPLIKFYNPDPDFFTRCKNESWITLVQNNYSMTQKNASILFGIIFQKLISRNVKLFVGFRLSSVKFWAQSAEMFLIK